MFIEVKNKSGNLVLLNTTDISRVDSTAHNEVMITAISGDSYFLDSSYEDFKEKLMAAGA